jgi:hypothetical protein
VPGRFIDGRKGDVGAETGGRERRNRTTVGTALERKEKKGNKAAAPTVAMAKGGGREPLTTKKKILMTLPQSMISTEVETRHPPPKH